MAGELPHSGDVLLHLVTILDVISVHIRPRDRRGMRTQRQRSTPAWLWFNLALRQNVTLLGASGKIHEQFEEDAPLYDMFGSFCYTCVGGRKLGDQQPG